MFKTILLLSLCISGSSSAIFKDYVEVKPLDVELPHTTHLIQEDRFQPEQLLLASKGGIQILKQNNNITALGSLPNATYGDMYQTDNHTIIFTLPYKNCLVEFDRKRNDWNIFSGKWSTDYNLNVIDGFLDNATYSQPIGLEYYKGTLMLIDSGSKKLRQISLSAGTVTSFFDIEFKPIDVIIIDEAIWMIFGKLEVKIINYYDNIAKLLENPKRQNIINVVNVTENFIAMLTMRADGSWIDLSIIDVKTKVLETLDGCCGFPSSPTALAVAHQRLYILLGKNLSTVVVEEKVNVALCEKPSLSNVEYMPIRERYPNGTVLNYTCSQGYYFENASSATITCEDGNTWSGEKPVCAAKVCYNPPHISQTVPPQSNKTYKYGELVNYTCRTGYKHRDNSHRSLTCDKDTVWIGVLPECKKTRYTGLVIGVIVSVVLGVACWAHLIFKVKQKIRDANAVRDNLEISRKQPRVGKRTMRGTFVHVLPNRAGHTDLSKNDSDAD